MSFPSRFGKYLLLERVNVGGMAEVFKAKTTGVAGFERILAIKRILPNLVEDDDFIRMFIDEARIAVQLNHANIVQIYELGKQGEHYYIAMEYVPSRDLRGILDRLRASGQLMPISQAAYVTAKVAEGLDYAHRRKDPQGNPMNIIHRDVSPQNVLVGFEGEVKVIDFGIAKAANRASKTQAGVLKGKFGYMSPEQVRGLPIDRRSDIFAVGVLLYEMLTGERLFIGESDFSTLERVRNADVIPPTSFNKKISPQLEQIVLKTLAREVEDRYQWASELAVDLQNFVADNAGSFNARRLSTSMRDMYALEVAQEKKKLEEFLRVSGEDVADKGAPLKVLPLPQRGATAMAQAPQADDDDGAGEFGEDKTFVIEASAAGMALGAQETDPHVAGAVPPPNKPLTEADEEDVSLYGGQDDDSDDDARTLVGAENPYYSPPPGGASPSLPSPPPSNATMEQPLSEVSQPSLATTPEMRRASMPSTQVPGAGLDPVAAAMAYDDDDAAAMAAISGSRGAAPGPMRSGSSAPSPGFGVQPAQPAQLPQPGGQFAPTNPPSGPIAVADDFDDGMTNGELTMAPPPSTSWAPAVAVLCLGGFTFLGALVFMVVRLMGAGVSTPAQLELVATGSPPGDVVVMLDDTPVSGGFTGGLLTTPLTEGAHVLKVTGTGVAITRAIQGTGGTVRQPVLFLGAGGAAPPADIVVDATDKAPDGDGKKPPTEGAPGDDKPEGGGEVAVADPPASDPTKTPKEAVVIKGDDGGEADGHGAPVAVPGGWRLLLAAVGADGVPVDGAEVLVNGTAVGVTPLETELDPALEKVSLRVRKKGFATHEVAFVRKGRDIVGPATVSLAMAPAGSVADVETPPSPTGNGNGDGNGDDDVVAANDTTPPGNDPAVENDGPAKDPPQDPVIAEKPPEPAPRDPPKETPRERPKRVIAKIQLGTNPFAKTTIDGRNYGTTPFFGPTTLSLPVGRHKVEFLDKTTGKKYTYSLTIKGVDPNNKAVISLNSSAPPRVTGQVELKKLN